MKITSFSFTDLKTKWTLEETRFDAFNLLVGVSGAGKTKIVEALRTVCAAALASNAALPECSWSFEFDHKNIRYRWDATTQIPKQESSVEGKSPASFTSERITANDQALLERSDTSFLFNGQSLPKLKPVDSALVLLAEETLLHPIRDAFRSVVFSEAALPDQIIVEDSAIDGSRSRLKQPAENLDALRSSIRAGQSALYGGLVTFTGFVLQKTLPHEWENLRTLYCDIFPGVKNIGVERIHLPDKESQFSLRIQEEGCTEWIPQDRISSGMLRTLGHLIELTVAPAGSVIVIDEFENSLGVNCMPPLVDFLLERAPDFQYIITSHHPYIINNLPIDTWKLVSRKGSSVRVTPARDIPALRGASHHQAFTRLINLPEYEPSLS